MIDIHSHILPGIDDGPATMEESIEMARVYQAAGYDTVIATPHFIPGTSWSPDAVSVRNLVDTMNRALAWEGIAVRVEAGMEIGMAPEVADLLKKGAVLPLSHSSYVLMETPFQHLPVGWDQMIFDLNSKGYQVILAHPERCGHLASNPALFETIRRIGCHVQVNWGSILGNFGSDVYDLAKDLTMKGYVQVMATDSHDAVRRNAAQTHDGIMFLESLVGKEKSDMLVRDNPVRILDSRALGSFKAEEISAEKKHRKRLFSWRSS